MLKKLSTLLFLAIALTITSVTASAQMTDDAVVAYVKQSMASGKTQNEIAKTLAARGVTKAQAERKQKFANELNRRMLERRNFVLHGVPFDYDYAEVLKSITADDIKKLAKKVNNGNRLIAIYREL